MSKHKNPAAEAAGYRRRLRDTQAQVEAARQEQERLEAQRSSLQKMIAEGQLAEGGDMHGVPAVSFWKLHTLDEFTPGDGTVDLAAVRTAASTFYNDIGMPTPQTPSQKSWSRFGAEPTDPRPRGGDWGSVLEMDALHEGVYDD